MNNNVLIKISGLQMVDDTGDNVESMSAGKYYLKKDKHYVLYEDMDDENERASLFLKRAKTISPCTAHLLAIC